jgi:hypothetical protein
VQAQFQHTFKVIQNLYIVWQTALVADEALVLILLQLWLMWLHGAA